MGFEVFILADGDDTFVKVIIGVVVFVIWGIGALANMVKKQGQASQRGQAELEQAMREQMEEARRRQMAGALEEMNASQGSPPMMRPIPPPPPMPQALQRPRGPSVPPMRSVPPPPRGVRTPFQSLGGSRTMPATPRGSLPMRQQQPQQRKPQKQRRGPVAAVPVPTATRVTTFVEDTPAVLESEIGQGSAPASPSRRAAEVAAASSTMIRLTPQNLRQQFILTEILQPPLALRDRPAGV